MNARTVVAPLCGALSLNLLTSTGAHAASTQKIYSSGLLVLVFLGFCALVVVVQLIPAMVSLYAIIKEAAASRATEAATAKNARA